MKLPRTSRPIAASLAAVLALATAAHADPAQHTAGLPVGAEIADFGLRSLDLSQGELKTMVWLSDYVGSAAKSPKKLVLLNFFATWCKPCIEELPVLARLQQSYGARGLQVLSVNFRADGESADTAIAATHKRLVGAPPGFPVLFDRYTNRNQLIYMGSKATLPCNILIGADGRVAARFQGGQTSELAALEQRMKELLGVTAEELALAAQAEAAAKSATKKRSARKATTPKAQASKAGTP